MPSIPTEKIMQERLELEYCPPLDSVLIAALVADLYMEPPTDTKIAELRRTLDLLATQADSDERAAAAGEVPTTTTDDDATTASDGTSSPWRSVDGRSTTLATTINGSPKSASAASDAGTSTDSFSSPLGFLSTAFPHISYERLSRALSDAAGAADPAQGEIDIVAVIEDVLTREYLAELDDRGIDAGAAGAPPPPKPWVSVVPKKKKGKAKARAVAINDVRQQHHILPRSAHPMTAGAAALDAWTAVASLSARMAALLPPHPDTHFASFFHSPSHHSPAAAARAALRSLPSQPLPLDTLVTLREILACAPELDALDAEARAQTLETDAGLCARATGGERLDDAIQLVWFLRELDDDHAGGWAFGPYHTGDGDSKPVHTSTRQMQARLPAHPPDVAPPPVPPKMMRRATAPAQAQTDAWSTVPLKPRAKPSAHAAFIPAYTRQTTTSASTSAPKKSSWAPAVSARPPTTLDELRRLRTEAIVNAGRAWQKGNARNRGGEVALFYAEQARELGERVRGAALEDARARVANARTEGAIDLHFLTVAEAVAVAREAVEEMEGREGEGKTLRIVTGRGRHSREGRSVLLPAVRTALVEDGWNVSSFDAGLIVRGRR